MDKYKRALAMISIASSLVVREHPLRTSPREGGRGSPQWGHMGTEGGGIKFHKDAPLNINIIKL